MQDVITLRQIASDETTKFEDFVEQRGYFEHSNAFSNALELCYRYKIERAFFEKDGEILGALSYTVVKNKLRPNRTIAISLPHTSTAGICGPVSSLKNVDQIVFDYFARLNVKKVFLRQIATTSSPIGDCVRIIDLPPNIENLWSNLKPSVRKKIKKAQKNQIQESDSIEYLSQWYELYAVNLKSMGTPPHPFDFWKALLELSNDKVKLLTFIQNGEVIAGGVVTFTRAQSEILMSASNNLAKNMQLNMLLFWRTIELSFENRNLHVSLGRSLFGSSGDKFKEQWTNKVMQVEYKTYLIPNSSIRIATRTGQRKIKWRISANILKLLPLTRKFICFRLPLVRRFIP